MSHVCFVYVSGWCLSKISFRYLEIIRLSESFENLLMHIKLDKAFLAPHTTLYEQSLVYIPDKNERALSTEVSIES